MNLSCYKYYIANDFKEYYFDSEGPQGNIRKLVLYDKINDNPLIYNLAFGDYANGTINDLAISNNLDRDLILATVANTINNFSDHFQRPIISIKGSTPSRTRLYQMGISGIWMQASAFYEIMGFRSNEWKPFQRNVNYESFYVQKKKKPIFEQ